MVVIQSETERRKIRKEYYDCDTNPTGSFSYHKTKKLLPKYPPENF